MPEKIKPRKIVLKPVEPEKVQSTDFPKEESVKAKPEARETPKLSRGMVKVKVLAGTLGWSGGFYEKGEIFEISRADLKRFGSQYYQIIE